jgi:hypothetical protein
MNKRFECPTCGAGIKPKDRNCFRCGESLDVAPPPAPVPPKPIGNVSDEPEQTSSDED